MLHVVKAIAVLAGQAGERLGIALPLIALSGVDLQRLRLIKVIN